MNPQLSPSRINTAYDLTYALSYPIFGNNGFPDFNLPLVASLTPAFNRGSGLPTYNRATTAYQTDFEGKLNLVLSGEARFQGARRVRNLVATTSQAFSNAAWTKENAGGGSPPTVSDNAGTDPFGGSAAAKIDFSSVSGALDASAVDQRANDGDATYTSSLYVKAYAAADVGKTLWLWMYDGAVKNVAGVVLTANYQRVYLPAIALSSNAVQQKLAFGSLGTGYGGSSQAAFSILAYGAMEENVTGQTNQNPSEYVSVGVLSAPFHGAGVDGVKYFDTLNGNTVASNVVTEATGTKIIYSSLDPLPSLLLHMDGANGGTTFTDVRGQTVTVTSAVTSTTQVKFGSSSGYFDGTIPAYLRVPATAAVDGTGDFTLDCWIYPTAFGSGYRVLFANQTSNGLAMLVHSDGTIGFGCANVSEDGVTSNSVTFGAWNHIAVVRSSGTLKMFINGVQGYSAANTTNFAAGIVTIGVDGNLVNFPYTGYIDEFRIALGFAIWTAGFTPPGGPYTGMVSNVAVDASGPLGYLAEGAASDVLGTTAAIRRTMTDAGWVSGGGGIAVAAATGADGVASAAAKLTASGANGTLLFTTVLGSAARTYYALVRRKTGTGSVYITDNGGTNWTDITASLNSSVYVTVHVTRTQANPIVGFKLATSGDAIEVDFNTIIAGSFATTPPPVNINRNADVDSNVSAGNVGAVGSIYLEYTPTHTPRGTVFLWGTYVDANNYTAVLHDATNLIMRKRVGGSNCDATIANNFAIGTTYKIAGSWDGAGTDVYLSGTKGTSGVAVTTAQIGTTFQTGADGNGANQPTVMTRNERIYNYAMAGGALATMTT